MTTTTAPATDEQVWDATRAAHRALEAAERKSAADPTNAALRAHVTMARNRVNQLEGLLPVPTSKQARKVAPVAQRTGDAVEIQTLPEGQRFEFEWAPRRYGRIIRQGPGSVYISEERSDVDPGHISQVVRVFPVEG
jgi:hypothetical protein